MQVAFGRSLPPLGVRQLLYLIGVSSTEGTLWTQAITTSLRACFSKFSSIISQLLGGDEFIHLIWSVFFGTSMIMKRKGWHCFLPRNNTVEHVFHYNLVPWNIKGIAGPVNFLERKHNQSSRRLFLTFIKIIPT